MRAGTNTAIFHLPIYWVFSYLIKWDITSLSKINSSLNSIPIPQVNNTIEDGLVQIDPANISSCRRYVALKGRQVFWSFLIGNFLAGCRGYLHTDGYSTYGQN